MLATSDAILELASKSFIGSLRRGSDGSKPQSRRHDLMGDPERRARQGGRMQRRLVYGRAAITGVVSRDRAEVVEDGAVYAEDGRIVAVGTRADLRARYPDAEETGSSQWVLLPGLVNAHHHVGLTPLQLGSPDHPLELWFASRLGARRPDLYLDTLYSAFEMIESGVTTVQHLHGWTPGSLEEVSEAANSVIRAYADIGMRASYSYAVRDQNRLVYGDDDAFTASLPTDLQPMMRQHFERISLPLEDHFTLYEELRARHAAASRTAVQLAPANLHWCSDQALERLAEISARDQVPLHMHLLETAYQKEYARRRTRGSAVSHLQELGLLGPRMTLGHGVWLTEADLELIAATGTCICHNCSSNLRLRSGVAPLNAFERRGITVAIGMDEAGINDDRDMLQELRMVLRQHRVPGMDDAVPTCPQVLRMATEHGAATTPFHTGVGRLEPGRALDLFALDWSQVTDAFLDEEVPVVDAVVQRAKSGGVRLVIVEGETIYADGRFSRVDRDAVRRELARDMARFWTAEEKERRRLGKAIFPHVKAFYDGYLDNEVREPFYRPSSTT
jgi:cytosine/adenosine deaminase-related metal-dependent hydrolase